MVGRLGLGSLPDRPVGLSLLKDTRTSVNGDGGTRARGRTSKHVAMDTHGRADLRLRSAFRAERIVRAYLQLHARIPRET